MLNPELHLNPNIFDEDVEQKPIRDGYSEGLVLAGDADKNVVALCADLTESTRTEAFAKKFPERFFECGVAEQNMATIAAGLGVSGKIPFIASYATFSPGRNYEQIRTTIAYNDSNVKIAGHHAGISVGPDGATHQATEDIALMRVLPNMKVFVPCDAIEAKNITLAAAKMWGPVYIRFAREKSPVLTTGHTPFTPGKAQIFWHPPAGGLKVQVVIIACGTLVYNALIAAKELEKEKIGTVVLNNSSIKPMDERTILELAEKYKRIVTVEEHQINGGMGSAVAELVARHRPVPMEFVGLKDTFGESGMPDELIEKYGMGVKDIKKAVEKIFKR
ncbi:transketolase family protein [bacterium]|nr:MAG: transketolase family protein [bacterium]